jgi:hypothetical protein
VANGSGLSRGDRKPQREVARLRALVPSTNAIVGIDLADAKQMVVVCDHDSKVLARRTFRAGPGISALPWTGPRLVPPPVVSPASPSPASRPGTGGRSLLSWRGTGRCRWSVCSRWLAPGPGEPGSDRR